jgi:hypothetical protein
VPLTQGQENLERELRVDQMAVNIEKMRADMAMQQKQLAWQTRKFVVSFVVAIAASVGAGVALTNWVNSRAAPPPAVQAAPPPAAPRG